jgi:hypothetical protein
MSASQFYSRFQSNPPSREDHDEPAAAPKQHTPHLTPADKLRDLADAFDKLKSELSKLNRLTIDHGNAEKRLEELDRNLIECREELAKAAEAIQKLMQGDPLTALVVKL